MVWVDAEYTGELAVLSTWLSALLPWSVSVLDISLQGIDVTVVIIRFLYFRLQYIFGVSFGAQERPFLLFVDAPAFGPPSLALGNWLWVLGGAVSVVPVAFSLVWYAREDAVERALPVDPVRATGALLGVVGLTLLAASAVFVLDQRITVPVGSLLIPVLAGVLLVARRT